MFCIFCTVGSVLHFGQNIPMATLLFWPSHKFVQKWSKLCQGKNWIFRKSSVLSQYLLRRRLKKEKKLAPERCTKFPELLIHLGGAPRMCFEFQKHLPSVYNPWPKALQNPNFSWQHPEMFCKLETLHWRNSIANLHRLCAVSTMQRGVYAVKT